MYLYFGFVIHNLGCLLMKSRLFDLFGLKIGVAPFMGAWIEIKMMENQSTTVTRRTLHGCVD